MTNSAIAAVAVLAAAWHAAACSCVGAPDSAYFSYADLVFVGTPVDIEHRIDTVRINDSTVAFTSGYPVVVTFGVSDVYKGDDANTVVLYTRASGASCGYYFFPDSQYLVFATVDTSVEDATHYTGLCMGNRRGTANIEWTLTNLGLIGGSDEPPPDDGGCGDCGTGTELALLPLFAVGYRKWRRPRTRTKGGA
jgi:hypothetical protein